MRALTGPKAVLFPFFSPNNIRLTPLLAGHIALEMETPVQRAALSTTCSLDWVNSVPTYLIFYRAKRILTNAGDCAFSDFSKDSDTQKES